MKKFFTLLFVCLISSFAYSQNPITLFEEEAEEFKKKQLGTDRHFIGLSMGIAFPEGEFGSVAKDDINGFAKTGFAAGIDGTYLVHKNIGIGGNVSILVNDMKRIDYQNSLKTRLPIENVVGTTSSKPWINIVIATGPQIILNEDQFAFDIRVLFGAIYTRSGEVFFEDKLTETGIIDSRTGNSTVSPTLVAGAGFSFPMPSLVGYDFRFFVKGDIISAAPNLHYHQLSQSDNFHIESSGWYKQPLGLFNFSAGIRYEFGTTQSLF